DTTIPGSCPDTYTIERTWTAVDDCGNASDCLQILEIEDITPPVIICPIDIVIECQIEIPPAFSNVFEFINSGGTIVDNCGIDSSSFQLQNEVSSNTSCPEIIDRVYRIVDLCGNEIQCTQSIEVNDLTPPSFNCPADLSVDCFPDIPAVISDFERFSSNGGTAGDNCGFDTETFSFVVETSTPSPCPMEFFREYQIVDHCWNVASCTQTISVLDDEPPVIHDIPEDVEIPCQECIQSFQNGDFEEPILPGD